MIEFLILILFLWLLLCGIRLAFRIAWGIAKVIAVILIIAAFPVLILCLLSAGGFLLLLPLLLVAVLSLISPDFQQGLGTVPGTVSDLVALRMDGTALLIIRRLLQGVI